MKAPDKLFLQPEVVFDAGNIEGHTSNSYDTVYIRKEALLELINKKLQESADRLDYSTNKAYAEILDKLNEM